MLKTGLAGLLLVTASAHADATGDWADAHVHMVDFFQEGEGAPALLEAMDEAGVTHAVVLGMPLHKTWQENAPQRPRYFQGDEAPLYYYSATDALVAEAFRALEKADRMRLFPFISGFNPTDKNAVEHVRRMLDLYPGVWRGIGEILTRHDDLTALTEGEVPRADHPALMRIYKLAGERGLPVLLHSNITSKREREPLYVGELEAALEAHPETQFVWAHAGASATLRRYQGRMAFLQQEVGRLLDAHDNLWIDLSWTVAEEYLSPDGMPDAGWLALVRRYPDRFLAGSDMLGHFDNLQSTLDEIKPFLKALPPAVAQQVARDNLLVLMEPQRRTSGGG